MLKIKIAAILLTISVCVFFESKTASKPRAQTNKPATTTNNSVVVEKDGTKCKVKAYRNGFAGDKPKSSIILAKPNKNSASLKTITSQDEVIFYITGTNNNGWFEISKIETTGGDVDETLFEGRGWIHSSLVDLSVAFADAKLYQAPRKKSRVLKKLVADESEARPVTCQGNWMKIKSGKSIGWLSPEGQCANPLTTCS